MLLASLVQSRGILMPALATAVGVAAAGGGVWLTGIGRHAAATSAVPRLVLSFSAGVLVGVALFGLLPELAAQSGWAVSLVLFAAGYALLVTMDRHVHPVCPTCAHDHDHTTCRNALHGFAAPLLAAAATHSFLDGWSIATTQTAAPLGLRLAVSLAVTLHKVPEGIALGGILRTAAGSRARALAGCVLAEGCTLAGGGIGLLMAPSLGTGWILYPLGLTAGWIFYLGIHAVHEEWKSRGAKPAFVSALTGLAGAAAIQRGVETFFR